MEAELVAIGAHRAQVLWGLESGSQNCVDILPKEETEKESLQVVFCFTFLVENKKE